MRKRNFFAGPSVLPVEVLEQILEESKYTYDYEYIYSAAAIIASFARREDLRQEFLMLDKKWEPK